MASEATEENYSNALRYVRELLAHSEDLRRNVKPQDYTVQIYDANLDEAGLLDDNPLAYKLAASAQNTIYRDDPNFLAQVEAYSLLSQHDLPGSLAKAKDMTTNQKDRFDLRLYSNGELPHSAKLAQQSFDKVAQQAREQSVLAKNAVPLLALAKARTGDLIGAEKTIATTPLDCDRCLRVRGEVASLAGDHAGAERWYDQAIARAPDLPQAYVGRGQARFRAGDLDGALSDARRAARISPHDCDPYGLWGDVLARRRQWGAAEAKYEEALRYAPAWPAARRARDEVARRA